jgi:DNA polymerase I-like protein with 3'-5' exonuclease and polymerase domains
MEHPETGAVFARETVANWLKFVFARKDRTVFMNANYDLGWLASDLGVKLPDGNLIHDIGAQAVAIDESRRPKPGQTSAYSLDAIAEWCGVARKDEALLKEAAFTYGFAVKDTKKHIAKLPARYVGPYAEQDAVSTLLCHEHMQAQLDQQNVRESYDLEMELVPTIIKMRQRGIRVNADRLDKLYTQLMAQYQIACGKIRDITGETVNIDHIRERAWLIRVCDNHGIRDYIKSDDGGKIETEFAKDWMRASAHPLPRAIAEAKQCHEAANKFVQGYLLNSIVDGRIHANVNQFKSEDGGTRTHRFSYSNPPLQQMPSRPDPVEGWEITGIIARELRTAFEPERGALWFAPDYSQQEYRLIVHYATLLKCDKADVAAAMYNDDPNTDFHNLVVSLTGLTRRRAKDVNFAKAYGAGVKKFALMTGMSEDEAKSVMMQYDTQMPFVRQLNETCSRQAEARGYIKMIDGARMHFEEWEPRWIDWSERSRGYAEGYAMSPCCIEEARERCATLSHPWYGVKLRRAYTHKAMNGLIQGSAARQTKRAIRDCARAGYIPLIQVHDELGFSVTDPKVGREIGQLMRDTIKISVPMRVDEEYGMTWGTAKYSFAEASKAGKPGAI